MAALWWTQLSEPTIPESLLLAPLPSFHAGKNASSALSKDVLRLVICLVFNYNLLETSLLLLLLLLLLMLLPIIQVKGFALNKVLVSTVPRCAAKEN